MSIDTLLAAAREVQARAYAPYSGFRVGAALLTGGGRIVTGCNVENAAYPQSQCAEASAVGAMVAAGEQAIAAVLVLGSGAGPCAPCGGCRQRLAEFAGSGTPVHMAGADGVVTTRTLGELLPECFALGRPGVASAPAPTAAAVASSRVPGFTPTVGLVLGSGLGAVVEAIEGLATIDYADLPGFPLPSTPGHAGRLVLGRLAGVPVACLQGRVHLYEGQPARAVLPGIGTLRELGCKVLILTNAAGSLRAEIGPGALVVIVDHLNLMGSNPLIGRNDEAIGPRFPDMQAVYDPVLRRAVADAAAALGLELAEGVYAAVLGPAFETPAEIRAYRSLGADLVGMSTVPEAIAARHCGLRVVGLSIVTNLAAGMGDQPLSHAETLAQCAAAAARVRMLLTRALPEIARVASSP